MNKAINDIYNNKSKKVGFDKSLVSRENFVILNSELEKYVEKMIELMKESRKTILN